MFPPGPGRYEQVPRRKALYEWVSEERRSFEWADNATFDAWQLRKEFLECPIEDWLRFLEMAGNFGHGPISQNDFSEWQRLLRKALVTPPREWNSLHDDFDRQKAIRLQMPVPIRFEWEGEIPIVRMSTSWVLDMMIATIQLDFLQGAEFKLCARHDCKSAPFQVNARHKIYCDSDCAHLVAVRRSRERAAQGEKEKKQRKFEAHPKGRTRGTQKTR
jgi:hypothetical protein